MNSSQEKTCSRCSGTFKSEIVLIPLATSGAAYLCSGCVEEAYQSLRPRENTKIHLLHNSPMEICSLLDQAVVGQDEAKRVVAHVVARHYRRLRDPAIEKVNGLIVGPTGTGKTLLARTASEVLSVPFAEYTASDLTPSGFEGDSFSDIFSRLLASAKGDVKEAERGIIFLDEIDKLTKRYDASTKGLGTQTQSQMLKILEGTQVKVTKEITINTSGITFILAGAFEGLDEIITPSKKGVISISGDVAEEAAGKIKDISEALIEYGLIREFVGRVGLIGKTEKLTKEDLSNILKKSSKSPLLNHKRALAVDGIEAEFSDLFIEGIIESLLNTNLGARGMSKEVERQLEDLHFNVSKYRNRKILISKSGVVESVNDKKSDEQKRKRGVRC